MDQKIITRIIHEVLFEYTSVELDELALDLQISDEPLYRFCDRFDLGDWFYDQMTLADIDIVDEVAVLADEHRKAEKESREELELVQKELQGAQV